MEADINKILALLNVREVRIRSKVNDSFWITIYIFNDSYSIDGDTRYYKDANEAEMKVVMRRLCEYFNQQLQLTKVALIVKMV